MVGLETNQEQQPSRNKGQWMEKGEPGRRAIATTTIITITTIITTIILTTNHHLYQLVRELTRLVLEQIDSLPQQTVLCSQSPELDLVLEGIRQPQV